MLKCVFVLSGCVVIAWAATALGRLEPKPAKYAHKEGCYISFIDRVIPFGVTFKNKDCTKFSCGPIFVQIFSCGTVRGPPGCKKVYDETVPYPECCNPTFECDHNNTTTTD